MSTYRLGKAINSTISYLFLMLISVFLGFPLVWMLVTSVKERREVFGQFLPSHLDFSNFARIWSAMDLPSHMGNSIVVVVINVTIVVVAATLAGYAFARLAFPKRDTVFYIFILAMMIPGQAILIPMFQYLKSLSLLNTLGGLALSMTGGPIAFAIFLMSGFFRSLPAELGDAGKIDGCTEWGVFRHIYLPLARPGIATVIIFQFMGTWNEFMFSTTFVTTPALKTIQPALFLAVGRYSTDYTALSAGLLLAIAPILIVFLLLQKQFIKGLTAGAFKG